MNKYELESVVNRKYSCSENPPETQETLRTMRKYEVFFDNEELERFRKTELKKKLP